MTHARPSLSLLSLALTASLLSACSSSPTPPRASQATVPPVLQPVSLVTVPLQASDSPSSVEAALHGTVLSWNDAGCTSGVTVDCEAIVGVQDPVALAAQGVGRLGRPVTVEANGAAFQATGTLLVGMEGARIAWAGGSLQAWTQGARIAWAGGTYAPVPQNTATWTQVHLQQAQALAPALGEGVTVAVIDTGLDLTHPAFEGALTAPSTWQDYVGADRVPQEEGVLGTGGYGHGTNVAGIVLQIAPNAKIMPLRVLDANGVGTVANVALAVRWAADHGANVINLSLGSAKDSRAVRDAVASAAARHIPVIASAGNDGSTRLTYPAANAPDIGNLLGVGSVDAADVKSLFSSYGRDLSLLAPGEHVYAPAPDGLLAAWTGTSMSAPEVAGGLALALGQPLKVGVDDLTDALRGSATKVDGLLLNLPYAGRLGSGRVDLSAFLGRTVR